MGRFIRVLALGLALAAQAGAAWAVTGLQYISTRGDWIGQGGRATYLAPAATVTASGSAGVVQVTVTQGSDRWTLDFAAPAGSALVPGAYPAAARYPFQSPLGAGLSMAGNGRGCNQLLGWFRILEYRVDAAGVVSRLAVDFVQNCEITGPPLYGSLRIDSRRPLAVPDLVAVAGPDRSAIEGEAVLLDGSQSFARRNGPPALRWTQVDGPAVALDDATALRPGFTAPPVGPEGATLQFRLDATDTAGRTAQDHVLVLVDSASAPRTQISFGGDPGDYITGGRSYRYDARNAVLGFTRNFGNGVSASINGDTFWWLDFAAAGGAALAPGVYENAQRFPFHDAGSPGLALYGDGRGCNTLSGRFTVHQAEFDAAGQPSRLEIDFEQHCEGAAPAARGQVLLNAVPHTRLAQRLRAARERHGLN